jgi:hypothetical protein
MQYQLHPTEGNLPKEYVDQYDHKSLAMNILWYIISMYIYHECKEKCGDMMDAVYSSLINTWNSNVNLKKSNCQNPIHISSSCICSPVQILSWLSLCKSVMSENGASPYYRPQPMKWGEERKKYIKFSVLE